MREGLVVHGSTLEVNVGHLAAGPALDKAKPFAVVRALIDTGSQESHVHHELAAKLGLPVIGERSVGGWSGWATHNAFAAAVLLSVDGVDILHHGEFCGLPLSCPEPVILGRTFLQRFVMTYDGARGSVKLSLAS